MSILYLNSLLKKKKKINTVRILKGEKKEVKYNMNLCWKPGSTESSSFASKLNQGRISHVFYVK